MRYISPYGNYEVKAIDGTPQYKFSRQGVLDLGSGVVMEPLSAVASAKDLDLIYGTTLGGGTGASCITLLERAGLGSLTELDLAGNVLSTLQTGYRGNFFEAPIITSPTTGGLGDYAGIEYIVLTGSVVYKTVTYTVGETFVVDGSDDDTTGTGTLALNIPASLRKQADDMRTQAFAIAHLGVGDELSGYYDNEHGYVARDSTSSGDGSFFGWTK